MNVIDLSHRLEPDMPVYPGDDPALITRPRTHEEHGFSATHLNLGAHAGTHMDAPLHMLSDGPGVDWFEAAHFVGRAAVLDVSAAGQYLGAEELAEASALVTDAGGLDFLLLRTGWDRHWNTPAYWKDWPELTRTAARLLTGLDLRGMGMDTPSPDGLNATEAHLSLFRAGMVVVENLCNLDALPEEPFTFSCLPLNIAGADGAPCRAVGLLQDSPEDHFPFADAPS